MKAGSAISMSREKGSRRTWRSSFTTTARRRLTARPPPREARAPRRLRRLDVVDEDVLERRQDPLDRGGRVAGLGEGPLDLAPALLGVADDDVDPRAEDRRLDRPGLLADRLERLAHPGRGHLEHGVPREDPLQLGDGAERHQPAGVDEGEAVAVLGLVEVVGGHEDRDALGRHLVDQAPEAPAGDGVDPARGLVEEHDARPVHHGAGEGQPLLPAAGQLAGEAALLALEPGRADGPRLALAGRGPVQAVDAAEEAEVLAHREVVVEAEALAHVADLPLHALGVPRDVGAEHEARARGGGEQAAQHADRGGLAGAVRAEEAEDLAFVHAERDPVHGLEGPEVLAELADLHGDGHQLALMLTVPTARSRPAAVSRSAARASVRARAARSCATSASRSSEDGMTPSR